MIRGRRIARTVIFAPISSAPAPSKATVVDNGHPLRELWQEHVNTGTSQPPPEGIGMANKIEIRPLDKKETTGDSGGNGGS
ncbi:hypothetical protein [Streptomyces sp. NPDC005538]|uniref:hypothetical protein n=1 Tax=Streptomyces sp. NPDC005538 TaxID=3157043 RepID=UPI0033AD0678